jgi:hypothetical protein
MASYYRKFILRFSKIATPLHGLLKKVVDFEWTAGTRKCFLNPKGKVDNTIDFAIPRFHKGVYFNHRCE